ncbi:MAG: hydrogenase maturation protein [Candidatus Marinimicrobia bacterium]|nr:hydrogenase maturation protein [Candidatus Neomarinimicrobiota bacterium]
MRILMLTHSFNSLAQRLYTVLEDLGHDLSVEFDIHDSVSIEAVNMFKPELVIAPYLRRKIPEEITSKVLCWIIHPGPPGDRGPSALDWTILSGESTWGVTILEATNEYDAGPVWASEIFPMRNASKSSIYRREISDAAVECLLTALDKFSISGRSAKNVEFQQNGQFRRKMIQEDRKINWNKDTTLTVLRKIWSSDGSPGVLDEINGIPFYLHDAEIAENVTGEPGEILGTKFGAICKATVDGAIWIGHLRPPRNDDGRGIKLSSHDWITHYNLELPILKQSPSKQIVFQSKDGIGYFHFPFYNGAMNTMQCQQLKNEILSRKAGTEKVWVLAGGPDFWSNGIHLGQIEQAESPADESKNNIEAMNDLVREIIYRTDKYIIAALGANAAAGGVFLSLSADKVIAKDSVVLNPHYRNMGNLYGSEYWTYLLPRRLSPKASQELIQRRLPITAKRAKYMGLIDDVFTGNHESFWAKIHEYAKSINMGKNLSSLLDKKSKKLASDNKQKTIDSYRDNEMEKMHLNFYGFDPSYHVARYNFIRKRPISWTPLYLAKHRTKANENKPIKQVEG